MCKGSRETSNQTIFRAEETGLRMAPSVTIPPESAKTAADVQENPQEEEEQVKLDEMHSDTEESGAKYKHQPPPVKINTNKIESEEADLQKAIAMSIQDQKTKPGAEGQSEDSIMLSAEDREVSRALEESLRSLPVNVSRRCVNPNDRKRIKDTPVGLVNLGNSCWFNVVAQTLYHLPGFREMILGFKPPPPVTPELATTKDVDAKALPPKLSEELSKLFALMLASSQKYVSPDECYHLSKGVHDSYRNEQEDVCEFIHKLLERLEVEFNEVMKEDGEEKESCGTSKDAQFKNPIMRLFYGQFSSEGDAVNPEENANKPENLFGQYPLRVLQFGDIHDSILSSMSSRLQDGNAEKRSKACETGAIPKTYDNIDVEQVQWFKTLPPVLLFSLSRYEYSQSKQITEKVHNKFEFPDLLYMDRYMELNKDVVLKKHVQVAAIKRQLNKLNATLESYKNFGTEDKKFPLKDILSSMSHFVSTKPSYPGGESCNMDVVTPRLDLSGECGIDQPSRMEVDSSDEMDVNDSLTVTYAPPHCDISQQELKIVQMCLSRWQDSVTRMEKQLSGHISQLEFQLQQMYCDLELQQTGYKLHAVVVHEGQASAGHYWVYIRNQNGDWFKFNDVQVAKSSWEELQQDSVGGKNNASAYCLMYTDINRQPLLFPNSSLENDMEAVLQNIPINLQEYVKQSNLTFDDELSKYGGSDSLSVKVVNAAANPSRALSIPIILKDVSKQPENYSCISELDDFNAGFYQKISTISSKFIHNYMNNLVQQFSKAEDIDVGLIESELTEKIYTFFNETIERVKTLIEQFPRNTMPSLLDFNAFLILNNANCSTEVHHFHNFLVMKQQSTTSLHPNEITELISMICTRELAKISNTNVINEVYKYFSQLYQEILHTIWHFVSALKKYELKNYEDALLLIHRAYYMCYGAVRTRNLGLERKMIPTDSFKEMIDENMIMFWRSTCALQLSDKLITEFKTCRIKSEAKVIVDTIGDLLCPVLSELSRGTSEDVETSARIRNIWVKELLENPVPEYCDQELIAYILQSILSDDDALNRQIQNLPTSVSSMRNVQTIYDDYKRVLAKHVNTTAL